MGVGNFKCAVCGTRYPYSAGQCTMCGRVAVIWDGAEDAEKERERQVEEAKATKQQAQLAAAAQKETRGKRKDIPEPLKPSWSTKFAVLAFIATGITLAAYDHDGAVILIGAAIVAGIAGAFYRQILAVAGVVAAIWIVVVIVGDDKPARSGSSTYAVTPPPPPPAPPAPLPPWIANQPSGFPHVLTGDVRDTFVPELGYNWVDRNAKTVAWKPGIEDPKNPRLLTSFKEGIWTDRLGYRLGLQAREELAKDAARVAPKPLPPNAQGKLFTSRSDFDLYCDAYQQCAIYHGIPVSYEALSHLEFHEDHHWVVVVMKDGRRLDLGAVVEGQVRPAWREMVYVEIARTKNGETVESRRLDQFTVREGSDGASLESYFIGIRGAATRDYQFDGKLYVGGIAVEEVLPNSPAQRAGLRKGDLVVAVEDKLALSVAALSKAVRDKLGAPVALKVIRDSRIEIVSVQPASVHVRS